ncbi:CerR family C-terminal domain-containing protein [Maridesulfovibrio hydrothermalis]|uniref:Transcriptional regulator, TetR family n=1 Tax=Maridesulfovibrio hydrothermalis AM13 = DSM 14728 TaxID=1121451 RepID=L0R7I2_9BACT|nr:CerR family C-terminal domain-containing protein [Maridesulfovibrio hydrothermalis]CCO22177.1 Transcriptional regulator, TetR family [Maridesulfovibrio hydrothermalis AM13 = DSM 14728]
MSAPKAGKSNKARGEETRERLINVGMKLFAMNGFNGVSMRNLAAEAEVNLATVGYHFGGKQGLYEAILWKMVEVRDEVMPGMAAVKEQVLLHEKGEVSKPELVAWFFRKMMKGMIGNPSSVWGAMIINRELAAPSESYSILAKDFFSPSWDSMEILLKKAMPAETPEAEVLLVGLSLVGIVLKFVHPKAFMDRIGWEDMPPERLEEITEILCRRAVAFVGCEEA